MRTLLFLFLLLPLLETTTRAEILVDGSTNPELISTSMAFEDLVWTVYLRPDAPDANKSFTALYAEQNGISKWELELLQSLGDELWSINEQAAAAATEAEAEALGAIGKQKVSDAVEKVSDGLRSLAESRKRMIKIMGVTQ